MMQRIMTVAIAVLASGVAGCVTMPKPAELASADFGEYPATYQAVIQNYMSAILKDPESATYRFEAPKKGFDQDGWAVGGKKHFGFIVAADINAKNSYGGYAGAQRYYFLLQGKGAGANWQGTISDITSGFDGAAKMAMFVDDATAPTIEVPAPTNNSSPQLRSKSDAAPVEQAKSWPKAAKDAATKRCEKQFESFQLQAVCLSNEKEGYEKLMGNFGMPEALSLKAKERCAKSFEMFQLQAVCMSNEYDGYKKMHE